MQRIEIFNCPMDSASMSETLVLIENRINNNIFTQHVVVNVAKLVNMQKDRILRESIQACDIINIDGMGVVWAGRILGHKISERVSGIDLFNSILSMSANNGFSVFFLGATKEVVEKTAAICCQNYNGLKVAGYHHGYFDKNDKSVVDYVKNSGAELLFVAFSSPEKELFINKWRKQLGVKFVMGVGGTFDIVAGKTKRAPLWMQRSGLEWFYRVIQEPQRMWKRYLITNSIFLLLLIKEKLGIN